jgi:hypothetical protein
VYDAFGRIVEQSVGSTWRQQWITQLGSIVLMTGTSPIYAYWPAPGNGKVIIGANGSGYGYLHPDWLGNARITSDLTSHGIDVDQAYSPYGEVYDIFGSSAGQYEGFATLAATFAPSTSGGTPIMWDTPNRELSYVGRWLSPDPAGLGAADPTNPQSWNRYAYMSGNPLSGTDPTGLDGCDVSSGSGDSGGDSSGISATCDLTFYFWGSDFQNWQYSQSGVPDDSDPWDGHPFAQLVFSQPVLSNAANTMNAVTAIYGVGLGIGAAAMGGSALGVGELASDLWTAGKGYYLIYGAPAVTSMACAELCNGMSAGTTIGADSSVAMTEAESGAAPDAAALEASAASVNDKLYRYLLNPENARGADKAAWFKGALGFTRENIGDLAKQIVFDPNKAVQTAVTPYGVKYNQIINIVGANGRTIPVLTAWIKGPNGVVRLTTALPGD